MNATSETKGARLQKDCNSGCGQCSHDLWRHFTVCGRLIMLLMQGNGDLEQQRAALATQLQAKDRELQTLGASLQVITSMLFTLACWCLTGS